MQPRAEAPTIRDKEFSARLEKACVSNPKIPTESQRAGKQKWVREALHERMGITVSPEATRKWFAGESRPRPSIMSALAIVLEVDEAWLSLGIQSDETPREKSKRNAIASGAVNYVAALIQMNGGNIAFPDNDDSSSPPDLFAIIRGKQLSIEVKLIRFADGAATVRIQSDNTNIVVIGVVDSGQSMSFDLVRIPPNLIIEHGRRRGGFTEVKLTEKGKGWVIGETAVLKLKAIQDLVS